MKFLLTSFLFLLSLTAISQVQYHAGYFINNEGQRTDCLILDKDWANNPDKFKYKLSADGNENEAGLETVSEFGLAGLRYIRATVKSELSSLDLAHLTYNRQPELIERTLFLKVIEDGPAVLYSYKAPGVDKFFFTVKGAAIEQLVYLMYKVDSRTDAGFAAGSNKGYLNQLQLKMNCGGNVSAPAFYKMNYKRDPLKKFFFEYNKCSGYVKPAEGKIRGRSKLNVKIAPGIDFSSLSVTTIQTGNTKKSDNQTNLRLGAEFEVILPFNQNKWAIVVEPTYQKFSSEGTVATDYSSIELPISVRHYFFVNPNARIFLNAGLVVDFPMGDKILNKNLDISGTTNAAVGAGFQYRSISVEYRFYTSRDLIRGHINYESDYSKSSVILGYTFRLSKE